MVSSRACLLLLGIAAPVGCSSRTSVKIDISAPGLAIASMQMSVAWSGHVGSSSSLPPDGSRPKLPGSVLLLLPDLSTLVEVGISATDDSGQMIEQQASVQSRPHHEVSLAFTLQPELTDAAAADLTAPMDLTALYVLPAPDLSEADLTPPPDLAPENPLVQLGAIANGADTLSASLSTASQAGTLLVFSMVFDKGADPVGPNGWQRYSGFSTANDAELWYLANNPGGITNASASLSGATASVGQISEWRMVSTMDVGSWCWQDTPTTSRNCTTTPNGHSGELGLSCFSQLIASPAPATLSPGSGWSALGNNDALAIKLHYQLGFALGLPDGAPVTDTVTSSTTGTWAGAIATFY